MNAQWYNTGLVTGWSWVRIMLPAFTMRQSLGLPCSYQGLVQEAVDDGVEGSAVVYKRDHCLIPDPKHGIHQQSQQQNVIATAASVSTETSLCLGQPRLNSISHAVQNQHGQQLIAVAHYSNCSVSDKVVPRALLVRHHTSSAFKGWWDDLGLLHQAYDSEELLFCGRRATIHLYGDTVIARRLVVVQHSQACLQFFLRNISVIVVVSCYR